MLARRNHCSKIFVRQSGKKSTKVTKVLNLVCDGRGAACRRPYTSTNVTSIVRHAPKSTIELANTCREQMS